MLRFPSYVLDFLPRSATCIEGHSLEVIILVESDFFSVNYRSLRISLLLQPPYPSLSLPGFPEMSTPQKKKYMYRPREKEIEKRALRLGAVALNIGIADA